jgi:hypothetical protein
MGARKLKDNESNNVKMVSALTIEDDHWLLLQNETPRKVLGKWLVILMGPNPKIGHWVLMNGTAQSVESLWRWEIRKVANPTGSWLFYGRKPEYRDGRWAFVSERPELFYTNGGKVVGKRVTTNQSGDLVIADNSEGSYKALSALNEKAVHKIMVGLGNDSSAAKPETKIGTVTVKIDEPAEEYQKIELPNGDSLSKQFKERVQAKMNESVDSLFHPVDNIADRNTLLNQGLLEMAKTEIWSKDRKHKLEAQLKGLNLDNSSITTTVTHGQIDGFINALKSVEDLTCLFSVNLQQVQLFFISSLLGFNKNGCKFELPDKVYEVQRRFSLRYSLPTDANVMVEFDHPRLLGVRDKRVILDISSGGLAFKANPSDKELFTNGTDLSGITFSIGDREVKSMAHICHCTQVTPASAPPFLKVGVSFKKIKPRDSTYLNLYVYEQVLGYLSKLRS